MQIHLAEPLWLLLTVMPMLGWLRHTSPTGRTQRLLRFADPWLLPRLVSGQPGERRRGILFTVAWLLACVALSAPYLRVAPAAEQRTALDVAIVLDISPSMQAQDITPTRLQRAKWELEDFLRMSPNDRRALVVFSANAYVVLPLTPDKEAVRHFLAAIDTHIAARRGSSLGLALERAITLLADSRRGSRAILLVTDGEGHDGGAQHAAREAGRAGIPVLILGVGTDQGAPVPDAAGAFERDGDTPVISRLARNELHAIAQASGGRYADLQPDDSDWAQLTTQLASLARENSYQHSSGHVLPLFPWFVAASVALFLWWGRPALLASCVVVIPFAAMFAPTPSHANPWQEQRALEALRRNDLAEAADRYRTQEGYNAHLGRGVIAYRRSEFREALAAFDTAVAQAQDDSARARAHYNAGNALARLDQFAEAAQRYRAALHLQPNYSRAALNLNLVSEQQRLRLAQKRAGEQPSSLLNSADEGAWQPQGAIANAKQPAATASSSSSGSAPPSSTNAATNASAKGANDAINRAASPSAPNDPRAGAGSSPTLSRAFSVQENVAALLQQRFRRLDSAQGIPKRMEKPW